MLFKLSNLNSNLALTLGYLNPASNNSALVPRVEQARLGGEICSSGVIMYKGHLD